ncbi:Acyl-CoA-binding protein -like protein 3 [Escovopsis weberi]|uniref:Acyl-CoA-binding protein-like protein 3 n=1 Tax=Escovopsis weberi TaxID=150374 RepID=A0A0N0RTP3_ESCWE|nr:Acyl-CoA-binding protein -like protein 3 [Escovopsis weberi]
MADSIDRVFVHALNTVKKIPKTGASRPPSSERLRLYGLYKQAMEGDVDGVMEQPTAGPGMTFDSLQKERDKWDAWNSQKGLSRTESKRRYVEALIETMHKYAKTADGRELVAELEFVWNQIKDTVPSSSSEAHSSHDGPMKVLSPMSEMDEAELRSQRLLDMEYEELEVGKFATLRWQRKMEHALTKLSAEVAALREQITTGREWRARKERSVGAWIRWLAWVILKHFIVHSAILCMVLLWMRRRKDRRLEDLVRAGLKLLQQHISRVVPAR